MRIFAVAALLLACAMPVAAEDADPAKLPGWMAGAWERVDGAKWADEYWTPARGGMMIGASRAGEGERLGFWEHMRIVREADGKLVFWAIAGDQKPVRFVAIASDEPGILFENRAHDFPQRIRYWREGNQLKARISLADGSNATDFIFGLMGE